MRDIASRFATIAATHQDCPAIVAGKTESGGTELPFGELQSQTDALAEYLRTFNRVDRLSVGILTDHGEHNIVALLGCWAAGAVVVPLDVHASPTSLAAMQEHAGCDVIVSDRSHAALVRDLVGQALTESVTCHMKNRAGSLVVCATHRSRLSSPATPPDTAALLMTSGSAGTPKGVIHSHRSLLCGPDAQQRLLSITSTDRGLWLAHPSTISGMTDLLRILLCGGCLVPYDLATSGLHGLNECLRVGKPSIVHFVPTVFRRWIREMAMAESLASMRILHLGGETVTRDDFELFRRHLPDDCQLLHNLGSTEAPSFRYSLLTKDSTITGFVLPLGNDMDGKTTVLVDPADSQPLPSSVGLGEIAVRSRSLATGYWRDAERTTQQFRRLSSGETLYLTGDLGEIDEKGVLTHRGRKDRQIKRLGRRIDLADIESRLLAHPDVQEVAVTAQTQTETTPLQAWYVGREGLTTERLADFANTALSPFERPEFHVIDVLPTLPNGKVDRQQLVVEQDSLVSAAGTNLSSPTEQRIARIWRRLLRVDRLTQESNFFALGGDSLQAVDCVHELEQEFDRRLHLGLILQHSQLSTLAIAIDRLVPRPPDDCWLDVIRDREPAIAVVGDERPLLSILSHSHLPTTVGVLHLRTTQIPLNQFRRLTLEQMSAQQADVLQSRDHLPSVIVGFSYGGVVAFALASELAARGCSPSTLLLIEPTLSFRDFRSERQTIPQRLRRWGSNTRDRFMMMKHWSGWPLSGQHRWRMYRPTMIRNLKQYASLPFHGDVVLVGTQSWFEQQGEQWKVLLRGERTTIELPNDLGHYAAFDSTQEAAWIDRLRQCLETGPNVSR